MKSTKVQNPRRKSRRKYCILRKVTRSNSAHALTLRFITQEFTPLIERLQAISVLYYIAITLSNNIPKKSFVLQIIARHSTQPPKIAVLPIQKQTLRPGLSFCNFQIASATLQLRLDNSQQSTPPTLQTWNNEKH